jgi:hypothetical protein
MLARDQMGLLGLFLKKVKKRHAVKFQQPRLIGRYHLRWQRLVSSKTPQKTAVLPFTPREHVPGRRRHRTPLSAS